MDLTIVNKNADFWDYTSDSITPALLIYGYEVYELDSNPGVQSDYIYVIANADGTYDDIDALSGENYEVTKTANNISRLKVKQ